MKAFRPSRSSFVRSFARAKSSVSLRIPWLLMMCITIFLLMSYVRRILKYVVLQMQLVWNDVFPSRPYLLLRFEEISPNQIQGDQDCGILHCLSFNISISRYIVLVAVTKVDTYIIVG